MPRRRVPEKRETSPDPRYGSVVVAKFITRMMLDGKKSKSRQLLYEALDVMGKKLNKDPVECFLKALDNVKPAFEVKSRRVGGSTYQVPIEIRESRRDTLAMRWIIQHARQRSGKAMSDKLSEELIDAFNNTGTSVKKKEDTHRMAEANKAFAHYRW
jgi:small subunit ribosomal protein S7